MITNKLLVTLNMHIRDLVQNQDIICLRYKKKTEDDGHWVVFGEEQIEEYIKKFREIYLSTESKLKIEIIMKKL
ncbi:5871_t:CDS:2 [Gigaspora margarita]|uniref:5871_t:CDS:1 n=1 Tax=Gigaspora margarita TaxID=4874 RepID=A0ABN7V7C1_GIGMA|nr:5871_t:CDS:2 [Gigaspora margarita]